MHARKKVMIEFELLRIKAALKGKSTVKKEGGKRDGFESSELVILHPLAAAARLRLGFAYSCRKVGVSTQNTCSTYATM